MSPLQSWGQFVLSLHSLLWIKICLVPNHFLIGYCSDSMVILNLFFQENPLGSLTQKWIKLCCLAKGMLHPVNLIPASKNPVQTLSVTYTSYTSCDPTSLMSLPPAWIGVILGPACSRGPCYRTFSFTFRTNRLRPWLSPHTVFTQAGRHHPFSRITWRPGVSSGQVMPAWPNDITTRQTE